MHIPGQEHTKVPNILVAQKMPFIQSNYPIAMKKLPDNLQNKKNPISL